MQKVFSLLRLEIVQGKIKRGTYGIVGIVMLKIAKGSSAVPLRVPKKLLSIPSITGPNSDPKRLFFSWQYVEETREQNKKIKENVLIFFRVSTGIFSKKV